ncbi:helix-turn-helix domain-containing protein [Amycolatopsis lexingtonensis]|uniref:helix-turn-helix domain-containing protein n=1 Tax=Amycolatopsis lexingtonensis TaxID=218822 RepID=UPI003F6EC326
METPEPSDPEAERRTERNRRMVEDWENGTSITQIAQRYGLSPNRTGAVLRQNGATLPTTGRGIKRDLDTEKIVADYLDGATIREIAAAQHVSYGKVHRLLQQQQVSMRPRGGSGRSK